MVEKSPKLHVWIVDDESLDPLVDGGDAVSQERPLSALGSIIGDAPWRSGNAVRHEPVETVAKKAPAHTSR
jgi:hypothetical protein